MSADSFQLFTFYQISFATLARSKRHKRLTPGKSDNRVRREKAVVHSGS
jgi:hypothetical protein